MTGCWSWEPGPIGLGVALFARLSGANVAVFDRDAERAAGAAKSIAGVTTLSGRRRRIGSGVSASPGDGFDVVFDATGSQQAMERGFDFVAHGGRYVLVSVIKEHDHIHGSGFPPQGNDPLWKPQRHL